MTIDGALSGTALRRGLKAAFRGRLVALLLLFAFCVQGASAKEFDYPAGGSRKAVGLSTDVVTIGLPVATAVFMASKSDWKGLGRFSLEAVGTIGTSYMLRAFIHERRPDGSDNHGFPSLHAATSFLTASFLMRHYGWKVGVPAYALSAYVAWGRAYAKKHRFWDLFTGAAIGTAVGLVFTTPYMEEHGVSVSAGVLSAPAIIQGAETSFTPALTATVTF